MRSDSNCWMEVLHNDRHLDLSITSVSRSAATILHRLRLALSVSLYLFLWRTGVARGVRGCGPHRAALASGANGRKLFFKIHVKIPIVISYVFACNKNKALQLQRVPILSILGYNIGSLAVSGSTHDAKS